MKLCLPYKEAKMTDISQLFGINKNLMGYSKIGHTGLDLSPYGNSYGKWLCAPENVKITNIIDSVELSESLEPLKRGYGIIMLSQSTPNLYHLYWHCLPIFPVKIGDYIGEGKIVAEMGNSGNVFRNGVYVPLEERPKSKNGTHLHYEMFNEVNGIRTYLDPMKYLDFAKQPNYGIFDQLRAMFEILKKPKVAV